MKNVKKEIIQLIQQSLEEKISTLKHSIESAKESQKNDTKSSAGDKFETGREMIQAELNKSNEQLSKTLQLQNELLKVELNERQSKVGFGSIVISNSDKYFMAIPYGKVELDKDIFFAISLASPVGKLLYGKQQGDSVVFQGKEIQIQEIF